jgi:glycine betaine/proline transport system permease protein
MSLPIGYYFKALISWMDDVFSPLWDFLSEAIYWMVTSLEGIFGIVPPMVLIVIFALIAWRVAGNKVAVFTVIAFLLILGMDLWRPTMQTLSLVIVSTVIALGIGIPLGIWASRNERLNMALRPLLDFMQTLPAFVYLIPAITFFTIGRVPGVISTVIFAMPPAIRLTNLGIRQVAEDVVEAAMAFGSTPNQLLFKVQLPLALPTIMAGVNQSIMLALSMVVIASMVGAPGLGEGVLTGITQYKLDVGFEAGLAVVLLAMFLDRVTEALGKRKNN